MNWDAFDMTGHFILRRVAPVLLTGAVLATTARAVVAQQTTTVPRSAERRLVIVADTIAVVRLEGIDSLLKALMQSRALEERIGLALREYAGATVSEARKRALEDQLEKIARSNVQMLSKVQMACSRENRRDRAPEGYLGVTFNGSYTVNQDNAGPQVFRFREPPEIVTVESGSPADRAGVRGGDRLIAVEGREVVGRDVVFAHFLVPGRRVPLRLDRDGKEQTLVVQVQKRPDGFGDQCNDLELIMQPMRVPAAGASRVRVPSRPTAPRAAPEAPRVPSAPSFTWTFEPPPPVAIAGFSSIVAGAQLTTLTDDFRDLTGATSGVMVQRVVAESPAALAGLKGGDVIVEAGDLEVTSARLLQRMIGESESNSLKLKVVRMGKARTVWLKW